MCSLGLLGLNNMDRSMHHCFRIEIHRPSRAQQGHGALSRATFVKNVFDITRDTTHTSAIIADIVQQHKGYARQ